MPADARGKEQAALAEAPGSRAKETKPENNDGRTGERKIVTTRLRARPQRPKGQRC